MGKGRICRERWRQVTNINVDIDSARRLCENERQCAIVTNGECKDCMFDITLCKHMFVSAGAKR